MASRLFATKGVAATSMREIAEQSGLHPSSIYYYFARKDEILEAILADVNRLSLEQVRRINADGGSPAVRLYRIIQADVAVLCSLPYDVNEVLRLAVLQEDRFAGYWKERQELNDEVEEVIVGGRRRWRFRRGRRAPDGAHRAGQRRGRAELVPVARRVPPRRSRAIPSGASTRRPRSVRSWPISRCGAC